MDVMDVREVRRVAGAIAVGQSPLGLHQVADPRMITQVKHPLPGVLSLVLFGLAAGSQSLRDLERLSARLSFPMRVRLKLRRRLPDTTMRDVLARLDPNSLRAVLHRQIRAAHRRKQLAPEGLPIRICAIDGKSTTTRVPEGPYAQKQGAKSQLRTMTCALVSGLATVVLDAMPIPATTNEMGFFTEVLDGLKAGYGNLRLFDMVSTDAGMTSESNAAAVRAHGWHYLMALKDTQPTLRAEAERLIGPHTADEPAAQTTDMRDNQTSVIRSIWITDEAAGYHGWSHLKTIIRVRREVRRDDGTVLSCADRYFVSSLVMSKMTASQWLRAVRVHWRVENDVHGILDRLYKEDDHPWLYATNGQLAVALLRRVMLNIMTLYRNVSRRGEHKGNIPWRELIHTVYVLLVAATEAHLAGLRWPKFGPCRARGQPS